VSEEPYEIEEYPPYVFEVEKRPGEHVKVRSKRVEEWGEEESETELPIIAYAPYEEFILPASTASIGSILTGLGLAQELFPNIAQLFQKYLPFLTAKVSVLSIPIPIISIIGIGLVGFSIFLAWLNSKVTIKL